MGEDGSSHNSEQPAYRDGKTAHGAFGLAHFHRLCRSNRMGRRTYRNTLRNRFRNMEEFQNTFRNYIAKNSGDNNRSHCRRYESAQFICHTHTDRSCNRLRKQCHVVLMLQTEDQSHNKNTAQAGKNTGADTGNHSHPVLLQQ